MTRWNAAIVTLAALLSTAAYRSAGAQDAVATVDRHTTDSRVADELLRRPVTLDLTRVPIAQAIDAAAASAKVVIQYYTDTFEGHQKLVTLRVTHVPLRIALDRMLEGTTLQVVPQGASNLMVVDGANGHRHVAGIVAGVVRDAKTKQPHKGATVTLDDSVVTTRTDDEGRYRFTAVSAGSHRITVRLVGYARQTKLVTVEDDHTASADFVLSSSVNTLDQVVVTATGAQRYRELGHVVTQLNADSLVKSAPISSVTELLQSRVPGLEVQTMGGGIAGGPVVLRLRGASSLALNSEPIVIVDGIRYKSQNLIPQQGDADQYDNAAGFSSSSMGSSPLNDLNVNDIESVEVVKGPSASTLYGPDASNGVIVITTKRGKGGKTEWNWYARPLTSSVPVNNGTARESYIVWAHSPSDSTRAQVPYTCTLENQYYYHVCIIDSLTYQREVYQQPAMTTIGKSKPTWQYGANVNGGTPALRYYFSGNYSNQIGGVQIPTIMQDILKRQLGVTSLSDAIRNPSAMQSWGAHASAAATPSPKLDLSATVDYHMGNQRKTDPNFFFNGGTQASLPPGATGQLGDTLTEQYVLQNLFSTQIALMTQQTQDQHILGSMQGTARPTSWLSSSLVLGLDIDDQTNQSIIPATGGDANGAVMNNYRDNLGRTMTFNTTATAQLRAVSFRTSAGLNYVYTRLNGLDASGGNVAFGGSSLAGASGISATPQWSEQAELGWYGQEVVGLSEQLFLDGGVRIDGTSRAGERYRPAAEPKLGLSWIASDAPFLRNRLPGVSELRLRTSWGWATLYPTTGMQEGAQYAGTAPLYGQQTLALFRDVLADPTLRPETSKELEYGADATLFGRLAVGVSWNSRKTHDELQRIRLPDGVPGLWANVGDVAQHGFEATASLPLFDMPIARGDIQFSYARNTSKLLSLGAIQNGALDGYAFNVGYPTDAVFTRPLLNVVDTVGGNADSVYESGEEVRGPWTFLGVLNPSHTMTLTPQIGLLHDRLRLSAVFDRETGFVTLNNQLMNCAYNFTCPAAYLRSTPLLEQAKLVMRSSFDFYQPGDFTRWRELNLSMDIPERFLGMNLLHTRLGFSHGSVSLQGRNLLLWSRANSGDPESRSTLGQMAGDGIPVDRSWGFRFDLTP